MIAQPAFEIRRFALAITMLGVLSACASRPSEAPGSRNSQPEASRPTVSVPSVGSRAAAVALQQVGVPYRYGGSTTTGFDCSGLVEYSYRAAGVAVPRTTGQLWSATAEIARQDLAEGDLLFFSIEGKMSHVGIYLGDQRFVHAPSSGRTVTVANLDSPFYSSAFLRGGRPTPRRR